MMKNIPYGRQTITDKNIEAIVEVLKSVFVNTRATNLIKIKYFLLSSYYISRKYYSTR